MVKNGIKAVEMTRRIQDAHYEQLQGKSPDERIAFYRRKAQAVEARGSDEGQKVSLRLNSGLIQV